MTSTCNFIVQNSPTDFYCILCDWYVYGEHNVYYHVNGSQHAEGIHKYGYEISQLGYDSYYCARCRCTIPGHENVCNHYFGKRHQHFLYDESNGEPPTMVWPRDEFFCAFISREAYEEYYCMLCGRDIYGCTALDSHIEDKRHKEALELYGNDISPMNDDLYGCRCCDCTIPGYNNVYVHIMGRRHQSFVNEDFQQAEPQPTTISWDACDYFVSPFVIREEHQEYYCIICGYNIYGYYGYRDHVDGKEHENFVKYYGCHITPMGDDNYYCSCCDCKVLYYGNVYKHIMGNRHQNLLQEMDDRRRQEEEEKRRSEEKYRADEEKEANWRILQLQIKTYKPERKLEKLERNWESFCRDNNSKPSTSTCYVPQASGQSFDKDIKVKEENRKDSDEKLRADQEKEENRIVEQLKFEKQELEEELAEMKRNWESPCRANNAEPSTSTQHIPQTAGQSLFKDIKVKEEKTEESDHIKQEEELKKAAELKRNLESPCRDNPKSSTSTQNVPQTSGQSSDKDSIIKQEPTTDLFSSKNVVNELPVADVSNGYYSIDSNFNLTYGDATIAALTNHTISVEGNGNHYSPPSQSARLEKNHNPKKKQLSSSKKSQMQKVIRLLNFDKDMYDIKEKIREIRLGLQLSLAIDSKTIYCLVCRKSITENSENYFEHLNDLDHCEYLEGMEKDHSLFELVRGQFSELYLAYQYMEEISEDKIRCLVCDQQIPNDNRMLRDHVDNDIHRKTCEKMHKESIKNLETITSRMQCDWYTIQKYRCVPCSANFDSEINFVEHLESKKHANCLKESENAERGLIYDFCALCALLWYGYRCTYAYHCDSSTHKWVVQQGQYVSPDLPESAKRLLAAPEKYVEDTIKYLDDALKKGQSSKTLIRDIENAVKLKFPRAKNYTFGSRVSGLGSPDSNVNIFLDCGDMYNGKISSDYEILYFVKSVHKCLTDDSQTWDTEELSTSYTSSTIKAHHRATGLSCDISFENGLAVETTKLIKNFNDVFPMCRKLILFLKQWVAFCNLSGSECITSYALSWYVIFYLQKQSILPSIATLIEIKNKSHIIAGWEVGVDCDFVDYQADNKFSLKEHLNGFFTFYASFDFRSDVACPILGETVKKRAFANPYNLPKEMGRYVAYIKKFDDPEPLRIDSVMCLQDPFDLQNNLTKAVSKSNLSRFRTCCAKSLDLLVAS